MLSEHTLGHKATKVYGGMEVKQEAFLTSGIDTSDQFHALAALTVIEIESVLIEVEYYVGSKDHL